MKIKKVEDDRVMNGSFKVGANERMNTSSKGEQKEEEENEAIKVVDKERNRIYF